MPLDITSTKPVETYPVPSAPSSSDGNVFPNTEALQASGCFSSLLFYDHHCTDFCIRMSNYFVSADPGWYEKEDQDTILELQFALKGDLHYQLQDGIKLIMTEGQYNMLYSPSVRKISWFDSSNSHTTTLDIHFSPSYLQKMATDFPELAGLLEKRNRLLSSLLSTSPAQFSPDMLRVMNAIIDCNYTGDLRRVYMQSKVAELLLMALERILHRRVEKKKTIKLRQYDVERLYESREYLMMHMENPPTLKELAHKVGINDFKLKKGYKLIFGSTIFEDFNRARMEKAKEYLAEKNKSMLEIALLTGYQDSSNFSRAFKGYFGFTPGTIKKHS